MEQSQAEHSSEVLYWSRVSEVIKEVISVSELVNDLKVTVDLPITIYEDNQAAIFISENPETKKSRHMRVKFHHIRESVMSGEVKLVKISTTEQLADIMTKWLVRQQYENLRDSLGVKRGRVWTAPSQQSHIVYEPPPGELSFEMSLTFDVILSSSLAVRASIAEHFICIPSASCFN